MAVFHIIQFDLLYVLYCISNPLCYIYQSSGADERKPLNYYPSSTSQMNWFSFFFFF